MDFGSYLDVCSHFDDDWADELPEEYFTTKGKKKGSDKAEDCSGSKPKGQSSSANRKRSSNPKLNPTKTANGKGSKRKCQNQATNTEHLEEKGAQAIPMLAGTSSAVDAKIKEKERPTKSARKREKTVNMQKPIAETGHSIPIIAVERESNKGNDNCALINLEKHPNEVVYNPKKSTVNRPKQNENVVSGGKNVKQDRTTKRKLPRDQSDDEDRPLISLMENSSTGRWTKIGQINAPNETISGDLVEKENAQLIPLVTIRKDIYPVESTEKAVPPPSLLAINTSMESNEDRPLPSPTYFEDANSVSSFECTLPSSPVDDRNEPFSPVEIKPEIQHEEIITDSVLVVIKQEYGPFNSFADQASGAVEDRSRETAIDYTKNAIVSQNVTPSSEIIPLPEFVAVKEEIDEYKSPAEDIEGQQPQMDAVKGKGKAKKRKRKIIFGDSIKGRTRRATVEQPAPPRRPRNVSTKKETMNSVDSLPHGIEQPSGLLAAKSGKEKDLKARVKGVVNIPEESGYADACDKYFTYECDKCLATDGSGSVLILKTYAEMFAHMKEHHEGAEIVATCCGRKFYDMLGHLHQHTDSNPEPQRQKIEKKIKRTREERIKMSEEKKCARNKRFAEYDKYFTYECDKCVATDGSGSILILKTYAEMFAHMKEHHKGGKVVGKCCGKKIYRKDQHLRLHMKPKGVREKRFAEYDKYFTYECNKCVATDGSGSVLILKTYAEMFAHMKEHHKGGKVVGNCCGKTFQNLGGHLCFHTQQPEGKIKQRPREELIQISEEERALLPTTTSNWTEYDKHFTYECDKCVASDGSGSVLKVKTYAEMYAHIQMNHKGARVVAICCGQKIPSHGMGNHIRFHQEFDVAGDFITCRKCNITFPKVDLQKHKNEKHNNQLCEFCGKDLINKSQHMKIYHSKKNLPCPECGKVLRTEFLLYVHRWKIHNIRKKFTRRLPSTIKPGQPADVVVNSYLCDHCGYTTTKKQVLENHIQHVHGLNRDGSVAKVQCPECPKIFKSKVHLKVHMSSHSTTPNYQCRFCYRRFRWSSDCYKHRMRDHPEEYALWKAQRMGSNAEKRDEGVKVQQTKSGPNTDIT